MQRIGSLRTLGVIGALFLAVASGANASSGDEIELVSRASGPSGPPADDRSGDPSVSADGRFVAFASLARNISPEDSDPLFDVYVRDLETQATILVSRGSGPLGPKGNGHSTDPSISADGRFVAFESDADNLTSTGAGGQIYVRDLETQTTVLASSVSGSQGQPANVSANDPDISGEGGSVGFTSRATNLVPDQTDEVTSVYLRDLNALTTEIVSRTSGAQGAPSTQPSSRPSLSSDGGRVAFVSSASLDPTEPNDLTAVFVRDRISATTELVSRASGRKGNAAGDSGEPDISANGERVTFVSTSDRLDPRYEDERSDLKVYLRDTERDKTILVSRDKEVPKKARPKNAITPSISTSGRYVAFAWTFFEKGGKRPRPHAYLTDLQREMGGAVPSAVNRAGVDSLSLSLSGSGTLLAFASEARLSPEIVDGATSEVYVAGAGD